MGGGGKEKEVSRAGDEGSKWGSGKKWMGGGKGVLTIHL